MSPIYLGLVGPIASGKGVLADHLKSLGFDYYSLSDQVRQEATRRNLPINRETLQNLGDEMRKMYGPCILAERALLSVTDPNRCLVFDSLRNPSEINLFRHQIDIKIIGVDAPVENRLHWYLKRSKDRGEDDPDMSAFVKVSAPTGRNLAFDTVTKTEPGDASRQNPQQSVDDPAHNLVDTVAIICSTT